MKKSINDLSALRKILQLVIDLPLNLHVNGCEEMLHAGRLCIDVYREKMTFARYWLGDFMKMIGSESYLVVESVGAIPEKKDMPSGDDPLIASLGEFDSLDLLGKINFCRTVIDEFVSDTAKIVEDVEDRGMNVMVSSLSAIQNLKEARFVLGHCLSILRDGQ